MFEKLKYPFSHFESTEILIVFLLLVAYPSRPYWSHSRFR